MPARPPGALTATHESGIPAIPAASGPVPRTVARSDQRLPNLGREPGGPREALPEAEPFDRHGPEPALWQVDGDADLSVQVARLVQEHRAVNRASIAIIAKTVERARAVAALLTQAGVDQVTLATTPEASARGAVVLPVHLAKGLEFDVAIVVDADALTYGPTAFEGRLLYVALTRALHRLHVLWRGALSPHLTP
jgi:DNA helicase-2/ATP-dependent DNA helicase PcrA